MQTRRLGSSGLRVSRLGLGTMTWGVTADDHEATAQLEVFLDAGGTLLDTAASYGEGETERLIGRLLTSVVDRDEIVLATKCGLRRQDGQRHIDTSRRALLDDLDTSLRRMEVEHVDLWQVHTWSGDAPLDETLSALDQAVASGRARYVGISNYSGWQTASAAIHQGAVPGRVPISSTQVEYSLLQRGVEREVVPAALALGLAILPWAPLGRGVLTGKYRTGTPADSRGASESFERYVGEHLNPQAERVVEAVWLAAEGLALTPAEVALAWVRDRPGVVAPIIGARTSAQLSATLRVEGVTLPPEIVAALDDVSAPASGYPER